MKLNKTKYSFKQIGSWLWKHHKGCRVQMIVNVVVGLLQVFIGLYYVDILRQVTDIATHEQEGNLWVMIAIFATIFVVEIALNVLTTWLRAVLSVKSQNQMQQMFFSRLLNGHWNGIEKYHSGDILNRLFGDVTDIIGEGFNSKFFNFLYESEGVPYPHKLQAFYKNQETGAFDVPGGEPFGFGEACKWKTIPMKKSTYNSSGYARMDYTFHVIDANGNDLGQLQYVKANGASAAWTDYWSSYYVGRAYSHFIIGVRDGSGITMVNTRWTSQ